MGKEIERKFKVVSDEYKSMATCSHEIVQGYISLRKESTVRVRLKDDDAYITVKGITVGAQRDEWEYPIPVADAREMLERVADGVVISKCRYIVPYEGHTWEVDEFSGVYSGLVLAEIELSAESDSFAVPPFVGEEVTGDPRFYNSSLASGRNS